MHSTIPNTSGVTRYSIDFRTVHLGDVLSRAGAPNVDSACTGSAIRDYLRGADFTSLPEAAVALYLPDTDLDYAASSSGSRNGLTAR